eukprot:scaffold439816_cov35-Prasinocladus_malaysianus.AAC.1
MRHLQGRGQEVCFPLAARGRWPMLAPIWSSLRPQRQPCARLAPPGSAQAAVSGEACTQGPQTVLAVHTRAQRHLSDSI